MVNRKPSCIITPGQWEDDEPAAAATPPGRVTYADQVAAGLVRGNGRAFVAPEPRPITPAKITVMPPAELPETSAPLSRAQSNVTGSYTDRAKGFSLVTNALGLTLGGLGVIVAVAGWGVPLLSVAALAWFGSLYAATWFCAYVAHVLVSAEGAAWLHVARGWRWLDREQAHRHELERHANGLDTKRNRR